MTHGPEGERLIDEVRRFVGFSRADEARLATLRPAVLAAGDRIVSRFYDALMAHEGARKVFEGPEQIERLKGSLHRWLVEAFTGPYDATYEASRGRIGQVHVRIGLPQRYMLTAMSVVRASLHEIVEAVHPTDGNARRDARLAVDRVLDMDLALMLETYQLGREAEAVRAFAEIARRSSDFLFTATPDRRVTFANRDGQSVRSADLLARGLDVLLDAMAPASRTAFGRAWTAASRDGRPVENLALTGRDPASGEPIHVLCTLVPDRREDGRIACVHGILRDVSALRRLEAEVEEQRRLASVGEMVAGVAHEVRNPLQNVLMGLRRIASHGGGEAAHEAVAQARAGADQIERLVADLLSFSRRLSLSLSTVDAGALVESALADCQAAGIASLPAVDLPENGGLRFRADAFRMTQVLRNLVTNALEASPGPGTVSVSVRTDGPEHVEIAVADRGPGLPPTVRERLFEPFVTTKPGGTGLGLAIARRLVEAHGGRLAFEDRPEGGTVVRVRLPRAGPPVV